MNSDFEITITGGGESAPAASIPPPPADAYFVEASKEVASGDENWRPKTTGAVSCSQCWRFMYSWFASPIGISLMLAVYLVLGAIMFMLLGNYYGNRPRQLSAKEVADNDDPLGSYDPDGHLKETTLVTVDRLWSITEDLNILYRDNWTHLAQMEMRHYQQQIVRSLRQALLEERYSFRQSWTFPCALLYALTLVTTIGYGFYTPTSLVARSLTIMYSLVGIPLFLVYLSIVGERVARVIQTWRCCPSCLCCRKSHQHNRRPPTYGAYSDVAMPLESFTALQPRSANGHAGRINEEAAYDDPPVAAGPLPRPPSTTRGGCCTPGPFFLCLLLFLAYAGLGSGLLALTEGLPLVDAFHLIVNLLLTLGFGTHLPGMSGESSDARTPKTSQISLLLIALYILSGMTLLAACVNVAIDTHGHQPWTTTSGTPPPPPPLSYSLQEATYHAFPSPEQQRQRRRPSPSLNSS